MVAEKAAAEKSAEQPARTDAARGLDEAPHFLAEARTKLLDPKERARIDAELHSKLLGNALDEFRKLLDFTLADKRLSKESEEKLSIAGQGLESRKQTLTR